MKETQIQSQIIQYLQVLENQGKLWFTRLNNIPPVNKGPNGKMTFRSLPPGSKRGIPDILILTKHRLIGVEVKTSTGKQSKEQEVVEDNFIKFGHEYFLVRSLDDVIDILEG